MTATVHMHKGYFNTGGGPELPVIISAGAACLAFSGPGRISLDDAAALDVSGPAWGVAAIAVALLLALATLATRRGRVPATA